MDQAMYEREKSLCIFRRHVFSQVGILTKSSHVLEIDGAQREFHLHGL